MTDSIASKNSAQPTILYRERQWVPWYWWVLLVAFALLVGFQFSLNRDFWWFLIWLVGTLVVGAWVLVWLSKTTLTVEQDADGTRWLLADKANLPDSVVARSMVVPESAKRNALGRQLDPAAFVISHGWVKELALIVLDDPEDPTPYWLLSSKNPQKLLEAFVPNKISNPDTSS
ncbi:DUF3093 domain-containing protein [Corynebacterium sp. S7]